MVLCGTDDHLNNVWQPKAAKDLLTNLILTTILQMIQCRLPLLQEEPQIFSSEIGIDCTYVHIIVNKLRFINGSSHQQWITGWSFMEFIIDGFIKNMFWSKTFEFGARVTFGFLILVGLSSIWPGLLKYCNIYTFLLKCYIQWPYATCSFILILEENRVVYNLSYKYCLCIFIIKKIMFI